MIRVTEVLVRAGLIDTQYFTELGARRGSYVHRACELDDLGQLDESTVDDQIRGRLEAWRKFRNDFQPQWIAIEHRLESKALGFCGTPDRIARMRHAQWVLDIKSGGKLPSQPIQLAGYAILHGEIDRIANVYLAETGSYVFHEWDMVDLYEAKLTFLAALRVARWKEQNGL